MHDPDRPDGSWAHNGEVKVWWQRFEGAPGAKRLLLVNALSEPSVAYQLGFIERLVAAGFDVICFDNRDVGRSSRVEASYTMSDAAADAVAVLDAAGWSRAAVFGQSMGGMISQQLVIDHPERVTHMISLMSATGSRWVDEMSDDVREALLQLAPMDRAGWLDHRVETERYWASPACWDAAWVRAKGEEMFDHGVDPVGAQRQYSMIMDSPDRDGLLAKVKVPALVMHGTADTLIGPNNGQHTAECIPGATYVEVDGLGHDLPPAYWDRLVSEVADFVLELVG